MPASNTHDCFTDCIGLKVVGVLFDALPLSDKGLAAGSKTLVFEDGTGLRIASNGSFGRESAETIQRAAKRKEDQLRATKRELKGVLQVAGVRNV